MKISGATRVAAVIGDPVRHSLSPALHNAAFREKGLDWVYVAFPVATGFGGAALDAMRTLGIDGLSVTMPHKADVAAACDAVSSDGVALMSVNTVVRRPDGSLYGDSTDGPGFLDALRADGFEPEGKACLVLGAGGAGRAVVLALARAGASRIVVVNRSSDRAIAACRLAPGVAAVGTAEAADGCALIVNATPQGMGGATPDSSSAGVDLPVDPRRLGPGQLVNDLVYHPRITPFLAAAEQAGARPLGGLGMLLHQAGRQFTLWTGEAAPIEAMRAAVNLVLAGRAGA